MEHYSVITTNVKCKIMVVYVANPLYDAVFKYIMEDDRIAKTILSALLKKKVVDVKIRRNE